VPWSRWLLPGSMMPGSTFARRWRRQRQKFAAHRLGPASNWMQLSHRRRRACPFRFEDTGAAGVTCSLQLWIGVLKISRRPRTTTLVGRSQNGRLGCRRAPNRPRRSPAHAFFVVPCDCMQSPQTNKQSHTRAGAAGSCVPSNPKPGIVRWWSLGCGVQWAQRSACGAPVCLSVPRGRHRQENELWTRRVRDALHARGGAGAPWFAA
jgi:hypothetical protein